MSYPTSLDSFTTKADTTDDVLAADINAIQAAVVALETELGTLPKGAYADVKARLAALATPSTPLTPSSLHATWGDHFTGASLDAKWTRVTYTSGDETYQAGGGSFLQIAPRAGGAYYYQSSTGIGSSFSLVGKFIVQSASSTNAFGLLATDASGNGGGVTMYTSTAPIDGAITMRLVAGTFNTTFTQTVVTGAGTVARAGTPYWLRLNYASGVISCQYSLNGIFWSDTSPTVTPPAFTLARVGFGGIQGTVSKVGIDWFDVQ
jgi:hypothetical protein